MFVPSLSGEKRGDCFLLTCHPWPPEPRWDLAECGCGFEQVLRAEPPAFQQMPLPEVDRRAARPVPAPTNPAVSAFNWALRMRRPPSLESQRHDIICIRRSRHDDHDCWCAARSPAETELFVLMSFPYVCLSRACLGKHIVCRTTAGSIKWMQNTPFSLRTAVVPCRGVRECERRSQWVYATNIAPRE